MNNYKLGELIEITSSKRIHAEDYVEYGVPFYRSKEIIQLSKGEKITEVLHISKEHYNKIKSRFPIPKNGDILLTSVGTIGIPYYVQDENFYFKDGNLTWFRNFSEKVNSKYLLFWMQSNFFKSQISNNNIGAVQKALTIDFLKKFNIQLPNLNEQKKITSTLTSIISKIELNNKINAELEAMAKTLYDYWFVQFDFPNVNGKPYKSSGGKMIWNEELKREIPEGWEVDTLSSFINNDKSGDWGKEQEEGNYNQKVYCVRGADINGLNGKGELKTPERYILEKNLFKTLDPHDLIVEISGGSPVQSTGRLAYITEETLHRFDAPIICSNFCKAVTLKSKYYFYNFVFQWNSIYDAGVLFGYEGKTSGIKNLLFESFVSSHYTAIPPIELAEKFYDFMKPIQIKKEKNLKENQELVSLRDWLLPMLMNGQVSLGDVEKQLGMVAEGRE
jgi:type I restriction enzyme S subunit